MTGSELRRIAAATSADVSRGALESLTELPTVSRDDLPVNHLLCARRRFGWGSFREVFEWAG
jgi:hypothetical protein